MKKLLCASLLFTAVTGCYTATIQLRPPGPPAVASIHSLQLNLIDLIEISSPVDINAACGGNAIAIEDSDTIVSGIINIILGEFIPIFSVWDAGVDCAGGAPAAPPGAAPSGG